jgi:P27 family predicted phage terminase small subunit
MRGRKPKPQELHIREGTSRMRNRRATPKLRPGLPTCPSFLDAEARKEWKRISKELADLGILIRLDRAALAAYCSSYSQWLKAETELAKEEASEVYVSETGLRKRSSWVQIRNEALGLMRAFLGEFGLSPVSRGRVNVPAQKPPGVSTFARDRRLNARERDPEPLQPP